MDIKKIDIKVFSTKKYRVISENSLKNNNFGDYRQRKYFFFSEVLKVIFTYFWFTRPKFLFKLLKLKKIFYFINVNTFTFIWIFFIFYIYF